MSRPVCTSCGKAKNLGDDGRCRDRAACLRRVTSTMATKPYIGSFSPEAAYADTPKLGDAV